MPRSHASLWFETVRHLEASQIWHRAARNFLRSLRTFSRAPMPSDWVARAFQTPLAGLTDLHAEQGGENRFAASIARAEGLSEGRFCFLNHAVDFGSRPRWHDPSLSRLWRYHLHYFNYVDDLLVWSAQGNAETAYQTFRKLACSWIEGNNALRGDGWHPYTISLRIVNWLQAAAGFRDLVDRDRDFRKLMLSSLYGQARFLARNLEMDVRGNHLLANLRALMAVATAYSGGEPHKWMSKALSILRPEIAEQILPDGGHFERAPGYHLLVLKHFLEIGLWLRRNGSCVPAFLDDGIRRMSVYLLEILPKNGQVPLLKDTSWDGAPPPAELLSAGALYLGSPEFKVSDDPGIYPRLLFADRERLRFSRWPVNDLPRDSVGLAESHHYVIRDDARAHFLIFDAGKPCPDYLPAHAHADLLSYELVANGERTFVDSGVYEYAEGPWRDYFRSTRAHNTVEVEGSDQSEVWSSFRVGRRARHKKAVWIHREGLALVQGEHDGYCRLTVPVVHRRTLACPDGGIWIVLDELTGSGSTRAASHLHLHPKLSLLQTVSSCWRVDGGAAPHYIRAFGEQDHQVVRGQLEPVIQGWYSESFGLREPNCVLTLRRQGILPIRFGYVVACCDGVTVEMVENETSVRLDVTHAGRMYRLVVPGQGIPILE